MVAGQSVLRNLPALRGRFYRPKTRRPERIGGLRTIARRRCGTSHVLFVPSTCSRQGRFAIRDRPNGRECAVVAEARMAVALGKLPLTRRGGQRQKWVDFGRRNPSAFRLHTKKRTLGYPGVCLTVFQQLRDFSLSSAALFHLSGTLFTFCGTRHRHDALAKIG
jgi:hypothetical protein